MSNEENGRPDRRGEFAAWVDSTAMPRSPYGQELLWWALTEIDALREERERRARG